MEAVIHSNLDDYKGMRLAGELAADVLDYITDYVEVGVSTGYLDDLCSEYIKNANAIAAPLNYRGFPRSICTSVNHVVCHGIPSDRHILCAGDIVNIDVTVILDGWYGDSSRMYFVGEPKLKARRLVEITYNAMWYGIEAVKPGATLGDIGYAIQSYAESQRCSVVTEFCGHEIGRMFHGNIQVMHYGNKGEGAVLKEGYFFTIEPMINLGKAPTKILSDGWTAVTRDRSLSAQFEHSLAVSSDGFEIFTLSKKGYNKPPYKKK